MKWSLHHLNLTIESNPHTLSSCLYFHFVGTKREEVFVIVQAPDDSSQRETYQPQTTGCLCYVNT
jgi:hypothetical protein